MLCAMCYVLYAQHTALYLWCVHAMYAMYTVCKVAAVNQILIFKYISFFKTNMDKPCHFPIYPSKFTMLVVPNAHAKSLWSTSKLMMYGHVGFGSHKVKYFVANSAELQGNFAHAKSNFCM